MVFPECDMAVFVPSFRVLDADIPRPATLIAAGLIALLILSVLLVLPRSSRGDRPSEAAIARSQRRPISLAIVTIARCGAAGRPAGDRPAL
jgi:hypothetical protein